MKKSAKSKEGKRSRERKLIQIKQSRQISPVKQVFQPQESKYLYKKQKYQRPVIPPLVKHEYQFTNEQIQSLSSSADALVSVQLIKIIIQKQKQALTDVINHSPATVQRVIDQTLKNVENSLNMIRQERVQRMKQDTVVFIPPDKDNFERHKGKVLNNWIKQQIQVYQQKQNIHKNIQQYNQVFKKVQNKINKIAVNVKKQKIEPDVQNIIARVNQRNKLQVQNKVNQLTASFLQIIQTADQMRQAKQKFIQQKERKQFSQQLQLQTSLTGRIPSHTLLLFGIQDYFM